MVEGSNPSGLNKKEGICLRLTEYLPVALTGDILMNPKARGEKGQRIVIGELAKYNIDVAIPLTDNLPFDLIIIYGGKLFKAQVKSSGRSGKQSVGNIMFSLTSYNWYQGTSKKYTKYDCDILFLCDYEHVYLLAPSQFENRRSFSIRQKPSLNGQSKGCNTHNDYILSLKRIEDVLV